MKHLIWLLPLLLLGCPDSARTAGQFDMTYQHVNGALTRYENAEAICYSHSNGGLQCKWKTPFIPLD